MNPPKLESVLYATEEDWKAITNSSRKNEVAGPNQKRHSAMDVSGQIKNSKFFTV